MKKKLLSILTAMLFLAAALLPAQATPFSSITAFNTLTDGTVVYASNWNGAIGSLYTWINSVLLPNINVLTTLGDMYVCGSGGSSLGRLAVGANGTVLTANSGASLGVNWASIANTTYITTKGDLIGFSTAAGRIPVGTNGTVLTADSTQPFGVGWETAGAASIPSGTIVSYNPSYGGNTIPTGWVLCDGNNSTPNLIGMFILGGQPTTSSSTANASGFGNQTPNSVYSGNVSHTHGANLGFSGNTGTPYGGAVVVSIGSGASVSTSAHAHTFSGTASGTTSATNSAPACYVLVYIMKV